MRVSVACALASSAREMASLIRIRRRETVKAAFGFAFVMMRSRLGLGGVRSICTPTTKPMPGRNAPGAERPGAQIAGDDAAIDPELPAFRRLSAAASIRCWMARADPT